MGDQDINADFKIDLDTRQAKQSLRQLQAKKRKARQQMTRKFKKAVAFGIGIAGSSANKFITPVRGDNVDPFEESLTPYIAQLRGEIDAKIGHSAKALTAAREESREALALYVGRTGASIRETPLYKNNLAIQDIRATGLNQLRQNFKTVKPGAVLSQFADGRTDVFLEDLWAVITTQTELIWRGANYIFEGIVAD